MAGGNDANGSEIIKAAIRSPFSAMTLAGGFIAVTTLWWSQTAGIERISERVAQIERRVEAAEAVAKEDKRESATKLDRLQNDMGDMRAAVRGLSVGVDNLNRNLETLIRQQNPAGPR
jgi:hypothetical protein